VRGLLEMAVTAAKVALGRPLRQQQPTATRIAPARAA
jgi:hypothetical protein